MLHVSIQERGRSKMDSLKLKDLLLELVEETKIARITVAENECRMQQLVEECHDKERQLEEEALKTQSLKDKHEETEIILSKTSDDKINHLEAEKTKLQLAIESWEKEMKAMKEEVRTLQLSKYNLERTVREQQHRLQTQGQSKTSHSEQVADIENRCKHLQKEMSSYSDTLNILKKEVTEAGILNRMLASTNNHQKCQMSSLRDELEKKQQEIIKLRVHVTEIPENTNEKKEMTEMKIEQLNKELKQVAQVNQDLKTQLEEARLAHQVTQAQLQESQDLAQRCMKSTKSLAEKTAQQEAQVAALTKECASLSEQRTQANTKVMELRQEMDEWEAKKKAEILILEEEKEKSRNECNNLKKAALNLEDINISWASKNQAISRDVQNLKIKLDSQSAELDKLKVPTSKFDKDTQTPSSTNNNDPYAGISRTFRKECATDSAGEVAESVKGEGTHTIRSEALNPYVEVQEQLVKGNTLCPEKDSVKAPLPNSTGISSQEEKIDTHEDDMKGKKTEKSSLEKYTPIADFPLKSMVLKQISECKGEDSRQVVTTAEYNNHQVQSVTSTDPVHMPGTLSDELCLNHEKDTQIKGSATEQNLDKLDSMTTQTTTNIVSSDRSSGILGVPANFTCTKTSEASMDNLRLPTEFSNNQENTLSLETLPSSLQGVETPSKASPDNEPEALAKTLKEVRSSGAASAVVGNQVEIYDEDIVIPSTCVEENSSRCRGEEHGEKQESETIKCDHDASRVSIEAREDGMPVTAGTRKREMQLSVTASSQVGRKNSYKQATKTLQVLLQATEYPPDDGESAPTMTPPTVKPKSMAIYLRSEDLSTSKGLEETLAKNTLEKSARTETDDIEIMMIQGKDGSQDISPQSRSPGASTDENERPIPSTNLCEFGDSNRLMRKEKFSSSIAESTFLQTPKRKHTVSSHDVTGSHFAPKPGTFVPDVTTAFSYLSNSEPLSSGSTIGAFQKHSVAKTKYTWSSPSKKSTELESATPYSSWKTLDHMSMHPQKQQSNRITRTPVMFPHLPSSAQQLHQSLHHITFPTASTIPAIRPTNTSLSCIAQQSSEPPRLFGLSQDSIPTTSTIQKAKEIHESMPRLTHRRSIINRSPERDDQDKMSLNSKLLPKSNPTSPKHHFGAISLQSWLPPGMDQDHGGAGDAGGEVSLFSDEEGDEDMKDEVASQIDRIQTFLKKDRMKRAKLE